MKRSPFVIVGAALICVALAALVWWQMQTAQAARPAYTENELATARHGTLIATVSATGAVEPQTVTSLAFLSTGNLASLSVQRGDRVTAGQTLARLDTSELELQVTQAEAALASAVAGLDKLKAGPSDSTVAAAQANLESARSSLAALSRPQASTVALARANYNSALAQYNALLKPDPTQVAIAKADVEKAKAALDQAQSAYDRIGGASNPFSGQSPQALQLQNATIDYDKAVNAFNSRFNATNAQLQAALAQLEQAKDGLARLDPTPENLARADAQVKAAEDSLARLTPTSQDLAEAEANVASAQAARDLARQRLAQASLVSPVTGIITTLDLDPGAFVQAGRPVVTIADLDHLRIALSIDETDIPRVRVGQAVALDLDAFPGANVTGVVSEVAPAAATVQGVVNYQVLIQINPSDVAIKPGMTANANVEVARKENVLLIPTRAIRAQGSRRLVTILQNGQPTDVAVTLGLSNEQETEILEGLAEGAQVLTIAVPAQGPAGLRGFGNQANPTPQGN